MVLMGPSCAVQNGAANFVRTFVKPFETDRLATQTAYCDIERLNY